MTSMDPYRAYNFRVTISGINDAHIYFTKCTGFSVTVDNQEYREGGNFQVTHQVPERVKYDPITLSYGVTNSRALWDWLMQAATGKVQRKNVTITVLVNDGETVREHYDLINAWPQQWEGTELDAASNQLAIAQLTLVYEQLKRGTG